MYNAAQATLMQIVLLKQSNCCYNCYSNAFCKQQQQHMQFLSETLIDTNAKTLIGAKTIVNATT